jgi:competence protein ComEC
MVVGPLIAIQRIPLGLYRIAYWPLAALRKVRACALAERERWPLWMPAGFGAGIGIYFQLPFEPAGVSALAGAILGVAAAVGALRMRAPLARAGLAAVGTVLLGATAAIVQTDIVAAPVLKRNVGPAAMEGRIETIERRGAKSRVVLTDLLSKRLQARNAPRHVRISIQSAGVELLPGQWIRVTAKLMPPPGPAEPGGYDFGRAAYFDGIGAVGFAYGGPHRIAPRRKSTFAEGISDSIELLRARMTERIHAAIPGSNGAIAAALITGDRGGIDPADTDAYRDAGIAHVLSISGLHLALAGGFFFWVVRALLALFPSIVLNFPIKKWAAVAALGGATFYILISGCDAPAIRSYIMLALMFGAILVDRTALTMRNVAMAAMLILAMRPQSLVEPGFEMSFGAVVGLIALAEWQHSAGDRDLAPGWPAKIRRYVVDIAIATIVASAATTPFAIYHFDRSTQYGLISNLLTVPLTGFVIMPAATAAMVLMPFGLEKIPLLVMGRGVAAMTAVAHFVADLPRAAALAPAMPLASLLLFVAGGLWIAIWRGSWRWLGIFPIVIGTIVAFSVRGPDMLIARDAYTVALRGFDDKLRFVRVPRDAYAADQWLKRDGDARDPKSAVANAKDNIRCDGYGCIARALDGSRVAVVARIEALAEDCANASILVSAVPAARHCRGPKLVLDKFDIAKAGGYAIWFGKSPRVISVEGERGRRPWSQLQASGNKNQYRRISPTSLP